MLKNYWDMLMVRPQNGYIHELPELKIATSNMVGVLMQEILSEHYD